LLVFNEELPENDVLWNFDVVDKFMIKIL